MTSRRAAGRRVPAEARRIVLRDIVTEADRAAALAISRGPGQDRFVASVAESFDDAVRDARAAPRYWTINDAEDVVGFALISDGVAAEWLVGRGTGRRGRAPRPSTRAT